MSMLGAVSLEISESKHTLGIVQGAIQNAAALQALIDNLIMRGLDPEGRHLFIVDGSKALSEPSQRTLGADNQAPR